MSTRPYRAVYWTDLRRPQAPVSDWSHVGRAASLRGALRAAILHLLDGRARYVLVENVTTTHTAARVWLDRGRITIVLLEDYHVSTIDHHPTVPSGRVLLRGQAELH